jgi:hypothetical protein
MPWCEIDMAVPIEPQWIPENVPRLQLENRKPPAELTLSLAKQMGPPYSRRLMVVSADPPVDPSVHSALDREQKTQLPEAEVRPALAEPERWERRVVWVVLLTYLVVQVNAILHHGTWGQDFIGHMIFIAQAYQDPHKFWTTFIEGQNNPPLFHLVCAGVFRLTRHVHSLEVISLIAMVLNGGALYLLHRLSLRMIPWATVRMATLVFLTFLPAGMIHAIVLAADCVTTPTVVLLMYLLVRISESGSERLWKCALWCVAACGALAFAVSVKFTSIALVPAAAVCIVAMWFGRGTGLFRTALALLLVVGPPAAVGLRAYRQYTAQQATNLGVNLKIDPTTSELNVRSVLFFRAADEKLLRAPAYDKDSGRGSKEVDKYELGIPNKYSYIGLLHVGIFTDILNVYQYDPNDGYFGPRTRPAQRRMALAVKTALPYTFCALVACPWLLVTSSWNVLLRRRPRDLPVLIVLTVSFAFWLVIVIFLPFTGALGGGYWLPRLVVPALFGFFLVTFTFIAHSPVGKARFGRLALLAAVLFQAGLTLSFMWPWGINRNEPPALAALVPPDMTVRALLDLKFSPQPRDTAEPLVVIGKPGTASVVFARHDGAGNVRISFNQWGSGELPESEPIAADPNRTYRVEVSADARAHTVAVGVDGKEVLRVSPWNTMPVYNDEVHLLKNPPGGTVVGAAFTGAVVSSRAEVTGGKRLGQ